MSAEIIKHLNIALKNKLTGINQYFLHARILKHQGNLQLADLEYKTSIDAMKHSDMLVEHILLLGGTPNLQELGTLAIGNTAEEMLRNDLQYAKEAAAFIKTAIAISEKESSPASVALLTHLLDNYEESSNYIQALLSGNNSQQKDCA